MKLRAGVLFAPLLDMGITVSARAIRLGPPAAGIE
jgi:hypothetical protein